MSCLCDDTCQSIPFFKQFTLDWQKAHRILSFLFGGGMMDGWLLLEQQKWTFSRGPLHKGHTYYPSSSCLNAQIVPPSGWSWVTITSTWVIVVVNVTIVHTIFWEPPSTFYLDNLKSKYQNHPCFTDTSIQFAQVGSKPWCLTPVYIFNTILLLLATTLVTFRRIVRYCVGFYMSGP